MLERHLIQQAIDKLSEILGITSGAASVRYDVRYGSRRVDATFRSGTHAFAIQLKSTGSLGHIARAVDQMSRMACNLPKSFIPLLVVPFMGESARAYCERAKVAWLDLSGNARIIAPGLYVYISGQRNKFRRPGRPESAFGPRGSRVARWLLMNPTELVRQRTLASVTGLNEGYVSRVVRKLIEMGLLDRDEHRLRIVDASRLLDAWHDEYRFEKHTLIRGHITPAAGRSTVDGVAGVLAKKDIHHAATGLAGAWQWTRYARFRLSTVYLGEAPSTDLLTDLGFHEEPRGANTWLVVPNDEGVFHGARRVDGVHCVHPVQIYLDLKAHPERASEAAEEIRNRLIARQR